MRLLFCLYKGVGEEQFGRLIYYLAVGHQVIVVPQGSSSRSEVATFTAAALARVLPRGCTRFVSWCAFFNLTFPRHAANHTRQ